MREIDVSIIEKTVEELFISANAELPVSLENLIKVSKDKETNETAKNIFCDMCKNLDVARENEIPICQDTGMAVFFVDIGNEVYIEGDTITDAINEGVRLGYKDGYLRKSIVEDPLFRKNTNDNTPAVIHYSFSKGTEIKKKQANDFI